MDLTALMCAVEHGSLNIVKLHLTKPECDVNIADNVLKKKESMTDSFSLKAIYIKKKFFSFLGWSNSC